MVDVRGATNDGLEDVPDVPVDLIVDHGDCGGAGREVVVGDDGKWSGSEKDDDGMVEDGLSDERVRLLERLNRENKQGTLTNFCIEFSSFGARKTTGKVDRGLQARLSRTVVDLRTGGQEKLRLKPARNKRRGQNL